MPFGQSGWVRSDGPWEMITTPASRGSSANCRWYSQATSDPIDHPRSTASSRSRCSMSARTSRAYCAMLWPPSLDGDAPCPRKSSATTRWAAASASMLRPKKWRDMQTPCSSTSGRPEPTSVTATVAPLESPIRFSVIPVPSLTVTIAAPAHDEVLGAAREVAAEIAPRADLHDREGSFSQENIDALWRAGIGSLSLPEAHGGPGANLRTTAAAV